MATAPDPGGARLRRRHSPRSRPASPRAPQRLAAMLELVRHRLRQWKERTGGGDPGGGAAGGGRGGARRREKRHPGPGRVRGVVSRATARGGGGGRSEGAEAVGGRGRPPPRARQRRSAPSRRPACRGGCRLAPRRRPRAPPRAPEARPVAAREGAGAGGEAGGACPASVVPSDRTWPELVLAFPCWRDAEGWFREEPGKRPSDW